jgi:hypothetical protein
MPEILTPTPTPIANIKNIKPIFFMKILRKDCVSESADCQIFAFTHRKNSMVRPGHRILR